jgi:transcriptional regulator with XRE-family HTH domain
MSDYLDELIDMSKREPAFAEAWEPIELMLQLTKARIDQGLSQDQVAQRMGIDRARIAEMEKNPRKVAFDRIVGYSQAVGAQLFVKLPDEPTPVKEPRRGRPVGKGSKPAA